MNSAILSNTSLSLAVVLALVLHLFLVSCSSTKEVTEQRVVRPDVPVITFERDTIHLGNLVEGETRELVFEFTNTGGKTLQIDLATACKCTDLRWTQDPVLPGQQGRVEVDFDSKGFSGDITKVVDIIANTDPIVREAVFTATVLKK